MRQSLIWQYSSYSRDLWVFRLQINSQEFPEPIILYVKVDGYLCLVHNVGTEKGNESDGIIIEFGDSQEMFWLKSEYRTVYFDKSKTHFVIIDMLNKLLNIHKHSEDFIQQRNIDRENEIFLTCIMDFKDKSTLEGFAIKNTNHEVYLHRLGTGDYFSSELRNVVSIFKLSNQILVYESEDTIQEIPLNITNRFVLEELNRLLSIAEFS